MTIDLPSKATLASWRSGCRDPGDVFLHLWRSANKWGPANRDIMPPPPDDFIEAMRKAVARDDGAVAVTEVLDLLTTIHPGRGAYEARSSFGGAALRAMALIDDAFRITHPRTRTVAPSVGTARIPLWLKVAEARRLEDGEFGRHETLRLVPNGPFMRHGRHRTASSGNSLRDEFSCLTCAPLSGEQEGTRVEIDVEVVGTDVATGVPASRSIGRETLCFIPLAEDAEDLTFRSSKKGRSTLLDVTPSRNLSGRLHEAARLNGDADLAIAPELTLSHGDEQAFSDLCTTDAASLPRIMLAGTGLTDEVGPCGRPWNEGRVFNKVGRLLWRQRKVWPYGMGRSAADAYRVDDPGPDALLMENVAAGDMIKVVDLDGFGRCVILICQDLEARTIVEDVITHYQPDWVLTPILDIGVGVGRWVHQRAFALSKLSQARLVVGSSLTLCVIKDPVDGTATPIGLAVGPLSVPPAEATSENPEQARAFAVVRADGTSPKTAKLRWNYEEPVWSKTTMVSERDLKKR
ncbi:hypothetical protein SAMN06297144_1188 [Sphingomonas guangdongensis]|uniref:Uncharacterized protein n=1 Tax=Sphingomonas guangdongensis TaxID=1141890 RepID=A0A285QFS9_9SPHN|nr:hypothetical protein [Sphingomonas guangdongensis]SOB80686.1 hypothetical protein SAMN06297144_1188 [Sphingomonas guangdongensis]